MSYWLTDLHVGLLIYKNKNTTTTYDKYDIYKIYKIACYAGAVLKSGHRENKSAVWASEWVICAYVYQHRKRTMLPLWSLLAKRVFDLIKVKLKDDSGSLQLGSCVHSFDHHSSCSAVINWKLFFYHLHFNCHDFKWLHKKSFVFVTQ